MTPIDTRLATGADPIMLQAPGVRVLSWRFYVARWLVGIASSLLRRGIELVEEGPPVLNYQASVEKHGCLIKLSVEGRAVLLDRADARHLGGILEGGWVGSVFGQACRD